MSYFTIEGTEYNITAASRLADQRVGDFEPDYDGGSRSDVRGTYRALRITTDFMTLSEALALQEILRTPGPLTMGGDLLDGDSVDFHVAGDVERVPLSHDLVAVTFAVRETNPTPSAMLFSFDGDAPGGYTFTRSGTVGPYTDVHGVLQSAAANRLRREWLWRNGVYTVATRPDTASHILEAAFTNLVSSDDFTAWTDGGGVPVVTSGISDPAGGTAAYRIEDDNGAASEEKTRTVTFTGNGVKACVFVVREATMPAAGVQRLYLFDSTAAAYRLQLDISAWVAGVPTVAAGSAGTYIGKRYVGNGYWALYAISSSVTAANAHFLAVQPAVTAAEQGSIDIYRANAYNAAVPPLSILAASQTKALETWYATHSYRPQVSTWLVDFIEGEYPTWGANNQILYVGNSADTGARFVVRRVSGADTYQVVHFNHLGSSVGKTVDLNPTWGDRIRLRAVLNSDGSVLIGGKKDSGAGFGAETVSSASSALAMAHDWKNVTADAQRVYLNGPAGPGSTLYLAARGIKGVKTMTQAEAYLTPRLHNRLSV